MSEARDQVKKLLMDRLELWDDSQCADCHNLDADGLTCTVSDNVETESCAQSRSAMEYVASEVLSLPAVLEMVAEAEQEGRRDVIRELDQLNINSIRGKTAYLIVDAQNWNPFLKELDKEVSK